MLSAVGWSHLNGVSDYVEAEEAALVGEDDGCEVDSPVAGLGAFGLQVLLGGVGHVGTLAWVVRDSSGLPRDWFRACADLYEDQCGAVLGDQVDLPGLGAVVRLKDPVAGGFETLARHSLAKGAKALAGCTRHRRAGCRTGAKERR